MYSVLPALTVVPLVSGLEVIERLLEPLLLRRAEQPALGGRAEQLVATLQPLHRPRQRRLLRVREDVVPARRTQVFGLD